MGHVTITTPLSMTVCHWWAGTSYNEAVMRYNKSELSTLTHYKDKKGTKNAETGVVWRLGVTQGHRQ